jgi:tetratricopeptide (TPR) repeat protein
MCGGNLEVAKDQNIGTCSYCGSQQTLPRLDDDERTNLYERAGHFRRNNEYDKALKIYERLLETDSNDSEAHWSVLLCKYGVEYVEDLQTHTRHITCNRTQTRSILTDVDYLAAIESADISAQLLYEQEAKEIDRIQKEALAIASSEEPFDIFLCYKVDRGRWSAHQRQRACPRNIQGAHR